MDPESSAQAGETGWKKCSACKRAIDFAAQYYVCNVSTCNRVRTAYRFCSVSCWEVHLPVARHREAWAEERMAPSRAEAAPGSEAESAGDGARPKKRRIIVRDPAVEGVGAASGQKTQDEILIVASRLKDYVRSVSGFNTSDRILGPLSQVVREAVGHAIDNARAEGRKTILDRDMPKR